VITAASVMTLALLARCPWTTSWAEPGFPTGRSIK